MSTCLEFYSVGWSEIGVIVGSRRSDLRRKIVEKTEPRIEEVYGPEDFRGGPDFEEGVDRWIQGQVLPPGQAGQVQALGDVLGFLAIIRFLGRPVGDLGYSGAKAGELFRKQFLEIEATGALKPPVPLGVLLGRPINGIESDSDILWGGLSASELAMLKPQLADDAPSLPDEDMDRWMLDLWNALGSALDLGKDLATVYG